MYVNFALNPKDVLLFRKQIFGVYVKILNYNLIMKLNKKPDHHVLYDPIKSHLSFHIPFQKSYFSITVI
jgi:hypothetical protein